jgi:mannitol/fructose-specific phosphotransferase system IIA component (Ntr-type)
LVLHASSTINSGRVDREFLYKVLLARESLGSTGIGDGIAIPHVRNPIVLHLSRPIVTLCFLERPVDFGALDGQPVNTLFTLISPTVRAHLHLLSRLAFTLRDPRSTRRCATRLPAKRSSKPCTRPRSPWTRLGAASEPGSD